MYKTNFEKLDFNKNVSVMRTIFTENVNNLDGRTDTSLSILKSWGVASVKKISSITDYNDETSHLDNITLLGVEGVERYLISDKLAW